MGSAGREPEADATPALLGPSPYSAALAGDQTGLRQRKLRAAWLAALDEVSQEL